MSRSMSHSTTTPAPATPPPAGPASPDGGWSPSSASRSAGTPPTCSSARSTASIPSLLGGLLTGAVLGASAGLGTRPVPPLGDPVDHRDRARPDGRTRRGSRGRRLPDDAHRPDRPGSRDRSRQSAPPRRWCSHHCSAGPPSRGPPPWPPSGPSAGRSRTPFGIQVDQQFTVFGSSGAVVVTALTAVLPLTLANRSKSRVMTRHVVFGTGQVGRLVVEQLVHRGARRRRRQPQRPGEPARGRAWSRGDATDPAFTTRVAAGADVVYFCLNAVELRPLGRGVPAAAARRPRRSRRPPAPAWSSSTTSTPTDPPDGRDLVETLPGPPDLRQGRHPGGDDRRAPRRPRRPGTVEVAIGRASDYFGPGTTRSALGETRVRPGADRPHRPGHGRPRPAAQLLVHPRRRRGAHHPRHPPRRHRLGLAPSDRRDPYHPAGHRPGLRLAGHRPKSFAAGRHHPATRSVWSSPPMREYLHTLYQFTDRWVVDDSQVPRQRSATRPPRSTTPWPPPSTWYRDAARTTAGRPTHRRPREGTSR